METIPGENSPGGVMKLVKVFLTSKLSLILLLSAFILGFVSILLTPKEEEPQIVVPLADIIVNVPGADPAEVEKLVSTPLERLLWQIDGVEYVYSVSKKDTAVVTARFYVGEDQTESLVKLHNKILMNTDMVPSIVKGWVIKPVGIDDVPIVNITLFSQKYDDHVLVRIGEEALARLSELENISKTCIVGGRPEEIRIELNPEKLKSCNISIQEVVNVLKGADSSVTAGEISRNNTAYTISSNSFLNNINDVKNLVAGVDRGRPVYLGEVADIISGPAEAEYYTRIGFSDNYRKRNTSLYPKSASAVTLAIAKKKGTNAVEVADNVIKKMEDLKKEIIPEGVKVEITRNYGETASEKVNSLLGSLGFAILCVIILLAFSIGKREALIVAFAVPVSFSLALFCNYIFGYTINRVTLFALILSLGLVVDDPITNVDNIQRHMRLDPKNPLSATLRGVKEVLSPVIMSTLAIVVCFVPLFFITGMMGPYMAPMAVNVPLTVIFSTLCALTIVPWISCKLLRISGSGLNSDESSVNPFVDRIYRRILNPFLSSRKLRYFLLAGILIFFVVSVSLAFFRLVPLKLLPFDNKNEFQIVIDLPEGSSLEQTDRVVKLYEDYLNKVPEVTSFVSYTGVSSPMDFNGMVRHYYLRKGSNLADIRVNLFPKKMRETQSHGIILRIRKEIEKIASQNDADVKLVEVPPGPPVLSTIVAEIYGDDSTSYEALISGSKKVQKEIFEVEKGVVETDDMAEAPRKRIEFIIDKEKAALHGVDAKTILDTLKISVSGVVPATLHKKGERQPYPVKLILPLEKRSKITEILQIPVKTSSDTMVSLGELVKVRKVNTAQPVYHKNLKRVVFVTAETAGRAPGEAVIDMMKTLKNYDYNGMNIEWAGEGEWKITLRVFRDMGIAFAAALAAIYIILVIQSGSFFMPVLIMMAIPLTILGIMPGFFLLNLFTGENIGGYYNPVFFTATSMIGMIALGGIVIRNSLVLIEFIQDALKRGIDFKEAIFESGAIRFRPIVLTALTTAIGAYPIIFDPVFSGLAWALIFGITASTLFTLVVIPVTYFSIFKKE